MKARTRQIEVGGIKMNVPVGSLDKPTEDSERRFGASQDPENWKNPVSCYHTFNRSDAEDLAYCLDFYCGGHELTEVTTEKGLLYGVSSKGYYHYVGA